MNRASCEEVQVLAPEVALGVASGEERALVLAHARSCHECRRVVEELSETADSLLLVGPLHDPAPGFESTVLAQMQAQKVPQERVRTKLIAAVLVSILVAGAIAAWVTSGDRTLAAHYRDALAVADGKYFGVVTLQSPSGSRGGHMFAYEGDPTWVFLVFTTPLEPGRYDAEVVTTNGDVRSLGSFDIAGEGTWGRELPVGLRSVRSVRVTDADGNVALQATFPSG